MKKVMKQGLLFGLLAAAGLLPGLVTALNFPATGYQVVATDPIDPRIHADLDLVEVAFQPDQVNAYFRLRVKNGARAGVGFANERFFLYLDTNSDHLPDFLLFMDNPAQIKLCSWNAAKAIWVDTRSATAAFWDPNASPDDIVYLGMALAELGDPQVLGIQAATATANFHPTRQNPQKESKLADLAPEAFVILQKDTDGDGLPDDWEDSFGCMKPLVPDHLADYDGDGLNNAQEYANSTNPCLADSDGDGVDDRTEVNLVFTDPNNPDTDGDLMPDGFEIDHPLCLDPLRVDDAMGDSDGDGLENINEYYNNWDDNVSDPCDPGKPAWFGRPGLGYFGDADGSLNVSGGDLNQIRLELSGLNPSYNEVYPEIFMVQDLDGSGNSSGGDLNLIKLMLSGIAVTAGGWPTDLTQELPVDIPSVKVGSTVPIQVLLTNYGLERPGFGVVFRVSEGAATLYGGEGWGAEPDSRYDLTNISGEARMVVQVNGEGTIKVHVELPAADPVMDLMLTETIRLEPDVEINGVL